MVRISRRRDARDAVGDGGRRGGRRTTGTGRRDPVDEPQPSGHRSGHLWRPLQYRSAERSSERRFHGALQRDGSAVDDVIIDRGHGDVNWRADAAGR